MSRPPVAVLVATRDRPELLPGAVASLAADLRPGDELVVAEAGDSGAAAALAALPAGGPRARLVTVPAGGKSRQLNAALGTVAAPLVLLTDDDCRVPPGWTDAMAAALADPAVAIAFGPVRGLTHGTGEAAALPSPGDAPLVTWTYAHGASLGARREALVAAGGFDERLGPGAPCPAGEDHDLLLRLRERGWRAVVADAPAVVHELWRSDAQSAANAVVYERGAGAFLGAALRRDPRAGWTLTKHRLGYLREVVRRRAGQPPGFARRAVAGFASGLWYGLRLRPWPEGGAALAEGSAGPADEPA